MKRRRALAAAVLTALLLAACAAAPGGERSFEAAVVETGEASLLVEPDEGTPERRLGVRMLVPLGEEDSRTPVFDGRGEDPWSEESALEPGSLLPGQRVRVLHTGEFAEGDPPRIVRCLGVWLVE